MMMMHRCFVFFNELILRFLSTFVVHQPINQTIKTMPQRISHIIKTMPQLHNHYNASCLLQPQYRKVVQKRYWKSSSEKSSESCLCNCPAMQLSTLSTTHQPQYQNNAFFLQSQYQSNAFTLFQPHYENNAATPQSHYKKQRLAPSTTLSKQCFNQSTT